ncbi:oligosaccharide flippase family protein [Natronoarchaeum rubrum]|uniref:oligosaccharide flippase family protein n=1 Tax=Natronoarchaeum rubrum TaxID=755311 RepID=UPI0021127B91|nr:oligosaccharide flippase family protein [Natronoarchaeum rubrum]
MMKLKDKIVSDAIVSTIIAVAKKARGLLFIPLISFYLGTSSFGVYTQLLVITNLFSGLLSFGLQSALIRYFQKSSGRSEKAELYFDILSFTLCASTLFYLLVYFSSAFISSLTLGTTTYSSIFQLGALLIPIKIGLMVSQNYYRAEMRVKAYSLIDGIKTYAIIGIVSYIVIFQSANLSSIITTLVMVEGLFFLIIQFDIVRSIGTHVPRFTTIEKSLRYSIPFMVSQVSSNFLSKADRLLIGYFLGPTSVGVYTAAYKLANTILLFALPINSSFFPEFSRLWEAGKKSEARSFLNSGIKYFLILSCPSIAGFFLVGNNLLHYLIPATEASDAAILVPFLGIGITCWGVIRLQSSLFFAAEITKPIGLLRLFGALLNVFLNIVLIPAFGLFGAVISTVASYFAVMIIILYLSTDSLGMYYDPMDLVKILFSSTLMLSIFLYIDVQVLPLEIVTAAVIYFIALYIVGGIYRSEVKAVLSPLYSIIK